MPRTRPTIAAATLAATLLASCGTGDAPSPADTATDPTSPSPRMDPTPTDAPEESTTLPAETAGTVVAVTVDGGEVTGVDERVTVDVGGDVTLRVTADVDDEIHVHGYDLHREVVAGEVTELTFTADIPGVFEVELEQSGTLLTKLEVR